MIRKNKEQIYSELKISLKRERNFYDSNKREVILDTILEKMEYIDIYYIYSNKFSNGIRFFDKDAIIIWDMNFWECFENYLMQVENCIRFGKNITQGITCVISEALSEKYKNISKVGSFLAQISKEFKIELQSPHEYYDKVKYITQICKVFSFFHEIGHVKYYMGDSEEIRACQELVIDMFSAVSEEDFYSLGEWSELGWKSVQLITEKKSEQILEELSCDIFAAMNMCYYYKKFSDKTNFQLAYECVVASEYLSTFQNMFNAINQAWDSHYTEMKFGLPVREKNVNPYINELAMSRNGFCSLILVIVFYNMLNIEKCEREKLWRYRDKSHVNLKDVISCLADDDFICQAIKDAFK